MPAPKLDRPLAFAHIMKTGGQTMVAILRRNFAHRHCDMLLREEATARDWKWARLCYPRVLSITGHCLTPFDEEFRTHFPRARLFTFLRDPVKRAVSHYQFCHNSGDRLPEFPEWVRQHHNYMTRRLAGEPSAQKAIDLLETRVGFAGLVEEYDESLALWRRWVGMGPDRLDISHVPVNRATSTAVSERIDASGDHREILEECHIEDRKVFDHVRNTLFERYRREYGDGVGEEIEELKSANAAARSNDNLRSFLGRAKRNGLYRVGVRRVPPIPKREGDGATEP